MLSLEEKADRAWKKINDLTTDTLRMDEAIKSLLTRTDSLPRMEGEVDTLIKDSENQADLVWNKFSEQGKDIERLQKYANALGERVVGQRVDHITLDAVRAAIPPLREDIKNLRRDHELLADHVWAKLAECCEKIKKHQDDADATVTRLALLEGEVRALKHCRVLHEMEFAKIKSATVQLFPKGDTPDLLSFLTYCDGALDCSPDGEMRLIFPEDTAVPLGDLMTAASLLRAHDPAGRIEVSYEGGIVVRLRPSPKGAKA